VTANQSLAALLNVLMRAMGLQGTVRGRVPGLIISDPAQTNPAGRVQRNVSAARPGPLWVAGFADCPIGQGFVDAAFVIDAFAPRIGGWRVSSASKTGFVLDALEHAIHDRPPGQRLIQPTGHGVQ